MYFDAVDGAPVPRSPAAAQGRRAERIAFDLLVRYAWRGRRATVMLKDLTRFGARIEGLDGLRRGDDLTLLLPYLPATAARVAWAEGRVAGLAFDRPLPAETLDELVADFATVRPDLSEPTPQPLPRAA